MNRAIRRLPALLIVLLPVWAYAQEPAAPAAPPPPPSPYGEVASYVAVSGVRDLTDYAGVSRALAQVPGVRGFTIEEATDSSLLFRVAIPGGIEALAAALGNHPRLMPAPRQLPGQLALVWQP